MNGQFNIISSSKKNQEHVESFKYLHKRLKNNEDIADWWCSCAWNNMKVRQSTKKTWRQQLEIRKVTLSKPTSSVVCSTSCERKWTNKKKEGMFTGQSAGRWTVVFFLNALVFVFREQTFLHVKRTEAKFAIAKFDLSWSSFHSTERVWLFFH